MFLNKKQNRASLKIKQSILENIIAATSVNRRQLIQKIQNFEHQTILPLTLANFISFNNIPLQAIYKRESWKRLIQLAGKQKDFENANEKEIVSTILKKWLSTNSTSYFQFILNLALQGFKPDFNSFNEEERIMLLMLHHDIWRNPEEFKSLEDSITAIGKNKVLVEEIIEVLEILIDEVSFKEIDIDLPYKQPLKVHSRYTRDQILTAFGFGDFEKKYTSFEGVAENKALNTEILFVDLIKSEEDFSPTTMYNDYAISETLFHWQSQNQTRSDHGKGLTYINHQNLDKKILLFVREKAKDEFGNTMGYVFIGEGNIEDYYGSKPMSINWALNEPLPQYLWNASAKMSVG